MAFIVTVLSFIELFTTSNVQSTGFSASIIKLKQNGEYLDLDPEATYLIHKYNNAQAIYAWLIKELQDKEEKKYGIEQKFSQNL